MDRYNRQILLAEIGEEGQKKLLKSRIAIIGAGALGSVVANNLVRAGVGEISIIDRDFVELNNLQRQMLFDETDIGVPKAIAAVEKLKRVNSEITVEAVVKDLNNTNIEESIKDADLVLDGTDNMQTRFLINDACVKNEIPWIYTAAIGTNGMTMTIIPIHRETPCFRCFLPDIPKPGSLQTCDTIGILNTVPVILASIESTEAIKILLGAKKGGKLIIYDAWNNAFDSIKVEKSKKCKCCVKHEFEFLNMEKKEIITSLCGRNAIQITPADKKELSLDDLVAKLERLGDVKYNDFILFFKTEGKEISIFKDGRAIIKGTDDEKVARSLYARYIGV